MSSNVPDLLKNVKLNLSEINPSRLSTNISHSPQLTVGGNNITKSKDISFDSLISSAAAAATSQRNILEQMAKVATETKGKIFPPVYKTLLNTFKTSLPSGIYGDWHHEETIML